MSQNKPPRKVKAVESNSPAAACLPPCLFPGYFVVNASDSPCSSAQKVLSHNTPGAGLPGPIVAAYAVNGKTLNANNRIVN
ncbi:hypothetical protein TUM12147_45870 [Citrobacter europaeus]|nr:hypothetical protein TUM12147_45870 [Citrobacter europaeus]GIZ25310.1 hypothetical protein TUM12148_39740 [Citrobacter europaeus]